MVAGKPHWTRIFGPPVSEVVDKQAYWTPNPFAASNHAAYLHNFYNSLNLLIKLLAQKWAIRRKINVYAPLHEPPHNYSTTYRQKFVEW
jgi:hypothetical protein